MLIVAKVTQGAAGTYADYLSAKTEPSQLGDYYLKDGERQESPGRWVQGAEQFEIDPSARVSGEQLRTLMAVRRPDTGQQLRRAGGNGEAVSAIDATFSAPKSVSTIWALARPELRARIEQAHETAIDRALTYAVAQVPMLRRRVGQDTVVHEKATGVVATSWRHTTARAVEDQVPDPQLHSHVLLHAAVRRDGRVVAIDSRSWLTHQREVGAAYRTELARELNELGFEITRGTGRGERYFELDGVPQPLIDRWSSRHHQVRAAIQHRLHERERDLTAMVAAGGPAAVDAARQLQALRDSGQLSPGQERLMGAITRSAKLPVTAEDLDHAWQDTARGHRFNGERVEVISHAARQPLAVARVDEVLAGLTEFDSTFPARDARAVALERSAGTPINTALDQLKQLRVREEILALADGSGTTRQHRGRERTVIAITQRLTESSITALPPGLADREADRLDRDLSARGGRLSSEQRSAIHLACGPHPLVLIEGQAGTGKSTALTGIARAHQADGRDILITSTAAVTAQRLATELSEHGVDCRAYSTAALASAITHDRLTLGPESTVIHDEAALASTREQLDLLAAVETSGARLIAVGDPKQNQPVGAGGLWQHIEIHARNADAHAELTINQRAQDPADRRDQALFRDGHAERAIRGYAARDHVHFHDTPQKAEDCALDAAHQDRADGHDTLVIAQTSNDHLDQLNARAQAIRAQAGELGHDSLPVPGRPYELHQGDEIQVRHTINHPQHGPLQNGTTAHVTDINRNNHSVALHLSSGSGLTLTEDQIADADLRLAYVQHPFLAQGQTTDTTHLIIGEHATKQGSYVALTRAREHTHLYGDSPIQTDLAPDPDSDRLTALADHLSREAPDVPSIVIAIDHRRAQTAVAYQPNLSAPSIDETADATEHQQPRDKATPSTVHDLDQAPQSGREHPPSDSPARADATDASPSVPQPTWPTTRVLEPDGQGNRPTKLDPSVGYEP